MTTFDRRKLFSLGLASAGASAAPAWLTRWFAPELPKQTQDPQGRKSAEQRLAEMNQRRVAQFEQAAATARAEGKPLLVLIVPDDVGLAWCRGEWFGALLNHGGPLATMELALCRIGCAKADEVRKRTGARFDGEPTMLLIDPPAPGDTAREVAVTPIDVALDRSLGRVELQEGEGFESHQKRVQAKIEQRLAALTEALVQAMHRHGGNLATLAERASAKMTDDQRRRLDAWLGGGARPDDALIVRGAALVRRGAARAADARRTQLLHELAVAFERSVVGEPIPGSRWMIPGGCGAEPERKTQEEKDEGMRIACGMAFVTPLCERFLGFYLAL